MKIPIFVALLIGLGAAVVNGETGGVHERVSPAQALARQRSSLLRESSSGKNKDATIISNLAGNRKTQSSEVKTSQKSANLRAGTSVPEKTKAAAPYLLEIGSLKKQFNGIYNFYLPMPVDLYPDSPLFTPKTNMTHECERDVRVIYEVFQPGDEDDDGPSLRQSLWAVRLMDSWGKSVDGILKANIRPLGFIDECLETVGRVTDPDTLENVTFNGQYCIVTTHIQLPENKPGILGMSLLPLQYGSCIPSSCTEQEFETSLAYQMAGIGYNNATVRCLQEKHKPDDNTWQIVGSIVILIMILPVAVATVLYACSVKMPPILKAFSAQENWNKLSDVSFPSRRQHSAVYGLRVLSMAWTIMGHYYNVVPLLTDNPLMIPAITDEWTFQMVWGSTYAAETFFTLSGLLTTLIIMKSNFFLERQEEFIVVDKDHLHIPSRIRNRISRASNMLKEIRSQGAKKTSFIFFRSYGTYIARRLLWLLPPILLVVMFAAGPSLFFMSGPFRRAYEETYLETCRQNWWVDLTLVSNFLPDYPSCMRISWYIAVDFQLFLVAPLFVLPIKVTPFKYVYLFCLVMISSIIRGTITLAQDLIPINLLDESFDDSDAYEKYVRNMPWARAAPFFMGALCALMVLEVDAARQAGTTDRLRWLQLIRKKPVAIGGWIVATITALAIVFGIVDRNYFHFGPTHSYNYTEIFFYSSFTSTAWSLCIGWIVIATYAGHNNGGAVGSILSHPLWVLPARYTYAVYVICYPLELMLYFSIHRLFFVSDRSFLLTYSGICVICFMVGIFISLIGEAPYVAASKVLLRRMKFI